MPWNKEGDWYIADPLQLYKERVQMSEEQPGMGGVLWTTDERNRIHNEATDFVMRMRQIPYTPENFAQIRQEIGLEMEKDRDHSERNGFLKPALRSEIPTSPHYTRIGD